MCVLFAAVLTVRMMPSAVLAAVVTVPHLVVRSEFAQSFHLEFPKGDAQTMNLFPRQDGVEFLVILLFNLLVFEVKSRRLLDGFLIVGFARAFLARHHGHTGSIIVLALFFLHFVQEREESGCFVCSETSFFGHEFLKALFVPLRRELVTLVLLSSLLCCHVEC